MSILSETILALQAQMVPAAPKHTADDETTIEVMNWVARETKMALAPGDLWVNDTDDPDNLLFSFVTRNGEIAMGIFGQKIENNTLESQLEPTEPPELVIGE